MKKLRAIWHSVWVDLDRRLRGGRILGLALVAGGFIVIGKAWDGAASINFVQGQIPYLLSGGFLGLGMIIVGSVLLVLASVRDERKALTEQYEHMATLLGRNLSRLQISTNGSAASSKEQVVAGESIYHRPGCKVLEGKSDAMTIALEQAVAEGLEPCRVCEPPIVVPASAEVTSASEKPGP